MGFLSKTARLLAVLMLLLLYIVVLWFGLTEKNRRSTVVTKSAASGADFVIVQIEITSVDTAQELLHERIRLIPSGRFALDQATPAVDLDLLINSVSGKQTVRFPKGERIFPIDFTSLISGNQNRYPFDNYVADIVVLVTTPKRVKAKPALTETIEDNTDPLATNLVVSARYLDNTETVAIREDFTASLPGVKFNGVITQDDKNKLMSTAIGMRRANNVISVSIMVMAGMLGLAISIMGMVLQMTASPGEINLVPLSLCIALIFGLPAMRNVQPGVPGVGVLSDYISFIWSEFIVCNSAIALAWTWIIRIRKRV
jgi:hypothetical protein